MDTAICGRIALSPNHVFGQKPGDKHPLYKAPCANRASLMALSASAPGKGGGVLERPTVEKTSPGRESEFDLRKLEDSEAAEQYCAVISRSDSYMQLLDMYLDPRDGMEPMLTAAVRLLQIGNSFTLDQPPQYLETYYSDINSYIQTLAYKPG